MHRELNRVRLAAASAALVLFAGGCALARAAEPQAPPVAPDLVTNYQTTPEPTIEISTESAPSAEIPAEIHERQVLESVPEKPDGFERNDDRGAFEAARYFLAITGYMNRTRDTEPLLEAITPDGDCQFCTNAILNLWDYAWATDITGGDIWFDGEVQVTKLPSDTIPNIAPDSTLYAVAGKLVNEPINYSDANNRTETTDGAQYDGIVVIVHDGETWHLIDILDRDTGPDES